MAEDRMLSDEILLGLIKANGGGGGTSDYTQLSNKPQINNVVLTGNKSLSDLGIGSADDVSANTSAISAIKDGVSIDSFADVETALADKADQNEVDDIKSETATLTGNPITLTDALSADAISVVAEIEPEQDLHGYEKPWAGGAGKNKFDYSSCTNNSIDNDGVLAPRNDRLLSAIFTVKPNTNYIVSFPSDIIFIGHIRYDASDDYVERVLVDSTTSPTIFQPTTSRIRLYFSKNPNTDDITASDVATVQCEEGSAATTFEPYSNICPISGMTEVNVTRTGKNLCNPTSFIRALLNANDGTAAGTNAWITSDYIPVKDYVALSGYKDSDKSNFCVRFCQYNADKEFISNVSNINVSANEWTSVQTLNANTRYIRVTVGFNNEATTVEDYFSNCRLQIEHGNAVTSYASYSGTTATASLGTTVYGGSVDVTEGSASVTMANIASYNGETIGEPWLSSMDEYVSGATPTTGAQVVYTLATPTTLSFTSDDLAMLDGENSVSTDAEEVSVEYIKNTLAGRVKHLEDESGVVDYSTTEQKTGQKWIDGKDIYQKTIAIDNPVSTGATTSITHGIADIETIVGICGGAYVDSTIIDINSFSSSNYYTLVYASPANIAYELKWGSSTFTRICVTVQYTKSTD